MHRPDLYNENLSPFETKILSGLKNNGLIFGDKSIKLGAGISGGADSVSLLLVLCKLSLFFNFSITVVSVNHFIREKNETCGDAEFVRQLCLKLKENGFPVECKIAALKEGRVLEYAEKSGEGIENAARILRYEAFEKIIEQEKLDYFCLAHNKNDQLETLLMRFLKGSGVEGLCGIAGKRDRYIRPMLDITRKEIEAYLNEKNQDWRTDSTNSNTDYLRNKIRHKLIPFLNQEFEGWDSGILSGAEKIRIDRDYFSNVCDDFNLTVEGNCCSFSVKDFIKLPEAVAYRVLVKACNKICDTGRIPFVFLKDVYNLIQNNGKAFEKNYGEITIQLKNNQVFVKKTLKSATELCFFDIIEERCIDNCLSENNSEEKTEVVFPSGSIFLKRIENQAVEQGRKYEVFFNNQMILSDVRLPLVIRSFSADDEIKTSSGSYKKVPEIFSSWHVPEEHRWKIPVIQELETPDQRLICILGEVCGFKNWIVNK